MTEHKLRTALQEAATLLIAAQNRRVLLVEDTPAHAAIIKRALEAIAWEVKHVTRGSAALEEFEQDSQVMVLLDLSLPDEDGLQLLTKLRALNPHAAIIVVTATDLVSVSVDAMRNGAWDYVVKDDPKETATQIGTALERAWKERLNRAETYLIEQTKIVETVRTERLQAIETIVRTVCHEVNNPLSGVVALSQMLSEHRELDSDLKRLVEGISRSAQEIRVAVQKLQQIQDTPQQFGGAVILSSKNQQ